MSDKPLTYYVTHPGAAGVAVASLLAGSFDLIEPALGFLAATVGTWYPLLGTLSSIAGMVPALPAGLFEDLFLFGAVAYAGLLLYRLYTDATDT